MLGDLRVNRWLNANDDAATTALMEPAMKISLGSKKLNEFGEQTGFQLQTLEVTPVTREGASEFFYGRLSGEEDLFLLDRSTALRLAVDLFDDRD